MMSMNAELLYEALNDPHSLERLQCNELEELVATYPYFTVGHLLLAKKQKQAKQVEAYERQRQVVQSFYRNPWWLYYQLELSDTPKEAPLFTTPVVAPPVIVLAPVVEEPETPAAEESLVADPVVDSPTVEPTVAFRPSIDLGNPVPEEDKDTDEDWPAPEEEEGPSPQEFPQLHIDLGEKATVTPLDTALTFEPFHTVDYFASLGIKVNLNESDANKFTQQLKSFTEWLKSMKRIAPAQPLDDLDAATESEIQHIAAHANQQKEAIATESMAQVWIMQGKYHKAVEVYHKLSLQHPEKRAYFATKIEQLNKQT